MISIAGVELEMFERGQGAPMLYLHGGGGIAADLPFIDLLAKPRRVIAPSHPGFGTSSLPDWLDSVDDIAHVYLELMDRLGLTRVDLVGISVGGWIAAEIATKVPERFKRLVLIGPVGVKTGTRRQARHSRRVRDAAATSSTGCGSTIRRKSGSTSRR